MRTVYQAEAYRFSALGSFGDASGMLICQHQYPHEFDPDKDKTAGQDHDRIMEHRGEDARRCIIEHTGSGELGIGSWAQEATPEQVLAFLKDLLQVDDHTAWTGFRILGSVHRGNGSPVFTLQLFAKHPKSKTRVYDTEDAPHLIQGSRHRRR